MYLESSKVVYAPIENVNSQGEEYTTFVRCGIEVITSDRSVWFHHFRHGSWTRRIPGPMKTYRSRTPVIENGQPVYWPDTVVNYRDDEDLTTRLAHCEDIVDILADGVHLALMEEEQRRSH